MVVEDLSDEEYVLRCFFEDENIRLRIADKIKEDYFEDKADKQIVYLVNAFRRKYDRYPTAQELVTGLNQNPGYSEEAKAQLLKITKPIGVISQEVKKNLIEDYFKFKVSQRLMEEYALHMHGKDPSAMRGIMPQLQDALNFKLTTNLGIHYIRDAKYAKSKLGDMEKSIPSRIGAIRQFTSETPDAQGTCGGYFRKCLSLVGGTSGGGKSMFMVNEAAFAATLGYNVVYISLELDAAKIWERVTSAILDVSRYDIAKMSDEEVIVKLQNEHDPSIPTPGNLFINWMPTRKTTPDDIEGYINELEMTEGIKIDFLVVDYIGIISPNSGTYTQFDGSFQKILYAAEQLRNIAVNRDMAILTGTQMQRAGYRMKDIGMDQTAGSMGLGDTVDFYYIIIRDVALKKAGFLSVVISKNRFGSSDVQFNVRVDWPHMRISDIQPEDMEVIDSIIKESIVQEQLEALEQRRPMTRQQQQNQNVQQVQQQYQQQTQQAAFEQHRQKKEKPIDPSFGNAAQQLF